MHVKAKKTKNNNYYHFDIIDDNKYYLFTCHLFIKKYCVSKCSSNLQQLLRTCRTNVISRGRSPPNMENFDERTYRVAGNHSRIYLNRVPLNSKNGCLAAKCFHLARFDSTWCINLISPSFPGIHIYTYISIRSILVLKFWAKTLDYMHPLSWWRLLLGALGCTQKFSRGRGASKNAC